MLLNAWASKYSRRKASNALRPNRNFGPHVVRHQQTQLRRSLGGLRREGFRHIYVLTSVEEGTAAGLTVQGESFAGKTGTAEIDVENGINRPWFIGFAPIDDPQVAVAVMLEKCQGCFGGEVAGPIATNVMEALTDG